MAPSRELVRVEARRRGRVALLYASATALAVGMTAGMGIVPWMLAVAGGTLTGKRVYDWLKYRGEYGLRF